MKISELIVKLEELKAEHGDIPVVHRDTYEDGSWEIDRVVSVHPPKKSEWWAEDKTQPAYQIELI